MMQVIVDDKYLPSKFTDTIVLDLLCVCTNQSSVTTRYDSLDPCNYIKPLFVQAYIIHTTPAIYKGQLLL